MLRRLVPIFLFVFVALIGVAWPPLPLNASLADGVFVLLAITMAWGPLPKLAWHPSDRAILIYLLGALPAIALSADHRGSAIEFVRELYLAAIYIVIAITVRRGLAYTIERGLIIGAVALSTIALYFAVAYLFGVRPWPPAGEVMTLPYVGSVLRLRALTPSEAMFACLITAVAPFAIIGAKERRVYWHPVIFIAAALTLSHAIAGVAVATVIALWPWLTRWPRRLAAVAAVGVVLAFNFAAIASIKSITYGASNYSDASQYHYAVDQHAIDAGGLHVTYNVMSYARIKQVAWRAFVGHPIAGVGLDQFHSVTQQAFEQGRLTADYREIDPHSTLPGRFAETGLIGGVTLLFLWFVWARMAIEAANGRARGAAPDNVAFAAAAALAGLAIASINADIMNFRFLWVIAGLLRGLQDANGMAIASGRDTSDTSGVA